jgi:hypothetical protein
LRTNIGALKLPFPQELFNEPFGRHAAPALTPLLQQCRPAAVVPPLLPTVYMSDLCNNINVVLPLLPWTRLLRTVLKPHAAIAKLAPVFRIGLQNRDRLYSKS